MSSQRWMVSTLLAVCFFVSPLSSRAEPVWAPLPAEAYAFGQRYPEAQRLLFAFDYGHALLYERLLGIKEEKEKQSDPEAVEKELLKRILAILNNPPQVKTGESDIAPTYAFTFPLIVDLFEWSHDLHQFVYDVLASSQDRGAPMRERISEILAKYLSDPNIALTSQCKSMLFMDGQYFSKAFRKAYPSLNLLIWSYHWFQVRLYEALMPESLDERDRAVAKTVRDFRVMISDLPDSADLDMMPEAAKEAPTFALAFPELPPVFDNLHSLHDILSDVLVSGKVPVDRMADEARRFGRMAQDPGAFQVSCPHD